MTRQYQYGVTITCSPRNSWDNLAIERVENQIIEYMLPLESESSQPRARIIAISYGLGDLTVEIWSRDIEVITRIREDLENLIEGINTPPIRRLLG